MAIDPTTTNTSDTLPPLDTSLPAVPAFGTPHALTANPYAPGSIQNQDFSAYQTFLGRDPEAGAPLTQTPGAIANSQEALTLGRARNEVNPITDAQIADYARQAAIQRTTTQNQLGALDPAYQDRFNSLQYGLKTNQNELNQQLGDLSQTYDVNYGRLNQSLSQIPLQAFQMANRRGLLDSSIAYDTLGRLAQPIQNNLADLTRAYGNNRSAAETKLQNIVEKYTLDRTGLVNERSQKAQALRDSLQTALAQLQSQASQSEAQRGAKIFARSGELGDQLKQYQLSQRQLDAQIGADAAQRAEAIREFNARFAQAQKMGGNI